MSGVSLAVGPRPQLRPMPVTKPPAEQPVVGGVMGSLRVIELQLVAFIMVFSVSSLVPPLDLAFPVLTSTYLLALARLAFPSRPSSSSTSRSGEILHASSFFRFYVVVGTAVGLFLPLAYVLGGFARGDEHAVRSATPHLFMLSCQILTENMVSGLSLFSPPVRAMVPLMYTVRRIFVVIDWVHHVWFDKTLPSTAHYKDITWLLFGRVLAVANLVYFSVNLFGFLIPRFLPRAFEHYFNQKGESFAKMVEGKQHSPPENSKLRQDKAD